MNKTMRSGRRGFTLMELLTVIAIISVLTAILIPTVSGALESARAVQCQTNLRYMGTSINNYRRDHADQFPPYRAAYTTAYEGTRAFTYIYSWGAATNPVNQRASWMYPYWDFHCLLCPSMNWKDVVPQAGIIEPTTTYGYNAFFLDGKFMTRVGAPTIEVARKTGADIKRPSQLIVYADSALYWAPASVPIFQNSTYLEPPVPGAGGTVTPTNHFRHSGQCGVLFASGSTGSLPPGQGMLLNAQRKLGFVSTVNDPYYSN
ncbi:MAG: type II secretion system GspH family protein [Planctomycetaceae bacterium]|nr:type II secretion system GspH family protein [Planctomycetaceae bacterium]